MGNKKKKKSKWKHYLIELSIVTIGLVLALLLNSWYETRKERIYAQENMDNIKKELAHNLNELRISQPHHKMLLEKLRLDPNSANLVLNPPDISKVAWDIAQNNAFRRHTESDEYYRLAKIYQLHGYVAKIGDNASEKMSEINLLQFSRLAEIYLNSEEDYYKIRTRAKSGWIPIFETWHSLEANYIQEIEAILNINKE